jgi:hypothetical protein
MAGYGTDIGLTEWLADNGLSLPANGPTLAVLRNRGSAYVDATYGQRLTCSVPTGGALQERAWPRTGHPQVPSDVIPLPWVHASYRAAYLSATLQGGLSRQIDMQARVQKQKVDVIERTFFDSAPDTPGTITGLVDAEIDGMVAPFLCSLTAVLGIRSIGSTGGRL